MNLFETDYFSLTGGYHDGRQTALISKYSPGIGALSDLTVKVRMELF